MASGNARFYDCIDWHKLWLLPLLPTAEPIIHSADWKEVLNQAAAAKDLRNHRNLPIRFVPQSDLPPGMAYEAYISETGGVPTRENLHDFFNALIWLSFPEIKIRLNALQATEIAMASDAGHRGKVRDAATIFDENAALFITSNPALPQVLRTHGWHELFVERRHEYGHAWEVRLFGHALMEKLVSPYKAITAHARIVMAEQSYFSLPTDKKTALLDSWVAQDLKPGLNTSGFTPLPVLGIPDWWPGQDRSFYEDVSVFRPKRSVSRKT